MACFSACQKSADDPANGRVEIFALASFEWVADGICALKPGTAVLETVPLVINGDIVSYDLSNFILEFKEPSAQRIRELTPRSPFAVTLNGDVVFFGVVMQAIMSSTCMESITMENLIYGPNKVKLELGYPAGAASGIADKRRDKDLLAALRKQGRLRE